MYALIHFKIEINSGSIYMYVRSRSTCSSAWLLGWQEGLQSASAPETIHLIVALLGASCVKRNFGTSVYVVSTSTVALHVFFTYVHTTPHPPPPIKHQYRILNARWVFTTI